MRHKQEMTVRELEQCYRQDIERLGVDLPVSCVIRGCRKTTVVRFTTDSADHFDSESWAELQAVS